MDKKNKDIIIDTKDANDKDIQLKICVINNRIARKVNQAYNIKVAQLVKEGAESGERLLTREELDKYLLKSGIWTQSDALELEKISIDLRAIEYLLRQGGMKLTEGNDLALKMIELRKKMLKLIGKRQKYDAITIEAVAEDHRFHTMLVECTLDAKTGQKYFVNCDDYRERADEQAAIDAACKLAEMVYGYDPNFAKKLFENQWLSKAGLIDEHGRLINKEGKYVDSKGKTININGRYIDEKMNLVDIDGRRVDIFGEFVVEDPKPFYDDDGNEIYIDNDIPKKKLEENKK